MQINNMTKADMEEREQLFSTINFAPSTFLASTTLTFRMILMTVLAGAVVWFILDNIQTKKDKLPSPHILYSDLDLTLRSVRDLLSHEIEQLIVDSKDEYNKIIDFVNTYFPKLVSRIELYEDTEPIFDVYGIELLFQKKL